MIESIFKANQDVYYIDADTLKFCYNKTPYNSNKFTIFADGTIACKSDVEYVYPDDLPLLHYYDRDMNEHIITDISFMCYNAKSLKHFDGTNWNTRTVKQANNMFSNCKSLEYVNMDFSTITNTDGMFYNCRKLTHISPINMAHVQTAHKMFYRCSSLKELDTSQLNMDHIVNAREMFSNCEVLELIDSSNWTLNNLEDSKDMFSFCNALKVLDTSNWTMHSLINAHAMFFCCYSLKSLDTKKWEMSNATDTSRMFWGCDELSFIDVRTWNMHNVKNMEGMFYHCINLHTSISEWHVNEDVIKDHMLSYSQIIHPDWL